MEGSEGHPAVDHAEALNAFRNVAELAATMLAELQEHGLTEDQAMKLTAAWLHGAAGGKLNA